MNRYQVVEEAVKNGRKKEVNYGVRDTFDNRVLFRTADKVEVQFVCDQMNDRLKEASKFG